MIIELRPGSIAVDPEHIVAVAITGSYPDKQVVVQMSTGQEFVIGGYQNPDFSADRLYAEITAAKAPPEDPTAPLDTDEIDALEWAVDETSSLVGALPDVSRQEEYAGWVNNARNAINRLKGDAQ